MNYNKALLIGNVTRDPEMRSLPSGVPVVSFGLATNRVWRDQSGAKKEDTQFHNIVVFGKTADIVSKYAKKGSMLMVEGRIQTRSWDDKGSGEKKYRTEIVAERIQLGPRSGMGGGSSSGAPAGTTPAGGDFPSSAASASGGDVIEYPDESANLEDIPF
ncbi:MAG TPA: single-stranded DNA-binding protein [Nitrososphaera sp.]|nr:single-stranded DNA-binding protein [Nitrososphaera sp.]